MEAVQAVNVRLCWNCEGEVPVQEENCTYCGVYVGEAEPVEKFQDVSVPRPPYQVNAEEEQQVPTSPYGMPEKEESSVLDEQARGPVSSETRQVLFPLALLLGGSVFFLFGIALMLFSHHGTLTLQWDGTYYWAYLLAAVIFIALGWRSLQHIEE